MKNIEDEKFIKLDKGWFSKKDSMLDKYGHRGIFDYRYYKFELERM